MERVDDGVVVRPMRLDDVPEAERLSNAAFVASEAGRSAILGDRSPARAAAWEVRARHFVSGDPDGCWVAEAGGTMAGFATSYRRESTWFLATFAVRPERQGHGIGRLLLDAALTHAEGCERWMLSAGRDERALAGYRRIGLSLHPQLHLAGVVDRSAIPATAGTGLREGRAADAALLDAVDRERRGSAHGGDHEVLAGLFDLVVADSPAGAGYAYLDADGAPALLAATTPAAASSLLWESVGRSPAGRPWAIDHVTTANDWAVGIALTAGLSPEPSGHLALRGMAPPVPYVHHGTFL